MIIGLIGAAVVSVVAVLFIAPGLIANAVQRELNGSLTFDGRVRAMIFPQFGFVAHNVGFTGDIENIDTQIRAQSAEFLIPLTGVMRGHFKPKKISLINADINLTAVRSQKSDLQTNGPAPIQIVISQSTVSYGSVKLENFEATLSTAATGETEIVATFFHANQQGNFSLYVADRDRLSRDGSPFDAAVVVGKNAVDISGQLKIGDDIGFSGRGTATIGEDLKLAGALTIKEQSLLWQEADIFIFGTQGQGDVSIFQDSKRTVVTTKLAMPEINMNNFDALWSEAALALPNWDGALELDVGDLTLGALHMGPSTVTVNTEAGVTKARLTTANGITAALKLISNENGSTTNLEFGGQDVALGTLLPRLFSTGEMEFKANLRSGGKSPAEVLALLAGDSTFTLHNAEVRNLDIAALVGRVSTEVISGWPEAAGNTLDIRAGSARFLMRDGIAATAKLSLQGLGYELSGSGEVDVLRAAIDLKIDPILITDDKKKLRLPVEIVVSGPWGNPQLQPDIEGILTDPVTAFAKLKAEGLESAQEKRKSKKLPVQIKAN